MFIEKVYDNTFKLFDDAIETFGDGFQIGDIVALPKLYASAKEIYEAINPALAEIKDLTPAQIQSYVNDFTKKLLKYIKKDTNTAQEHGVEETLNFIQRLSYLLIELKEIFSNGLSFEDIKAAPGIVNSLTMLYVKSSLVKEELKELNNAEIAHIASYLVYQVYVTVTEIKLSATNN